MRQAMDRCRPEANPSTAAATTSCWAGAICLAGTEPTDRLLVSLLVRDMLRAGLSRRDMPAADRVPFRLFLDELISLDGAASTAIAEITEQLRKFGVRMHDSMSVRKTSKSR